MKWWLIVVLCALPLAGCSDYQGVGVGNGFQGEESRLAIYKSPAKFQVYYDKELYLDETDEAAGKVVIDNRKQAPDKKMRSRIEFDVAFYKRDYPGYSSSKRLEDHLRGMLKDLRSKFPDEDWEPVKFPGASGFFVESREGEHLRSTYYILTTNFDRVTVEIDARAVGNGLAWVAPIINTFTYDGQPPVVYELAIDGPLEAGKPGRLKFRASDDLSGIAEFKSGCSAFRYTTMDTNYSLALHVCGSVTPLGDGWYAIPIDVNASRPTGEYYLEEFNITDKADNYASLRSRKTDGKLESHYYVQQDGKTAVSAIPVLRITVVNPGRADISAPKIHAIEVSPLVAGQPGELRFQATDDVSGIADFKGGCSNFLPEGSTTYASPIYVCGVIRPIPGRTDWYSIGIDVNKYRPKGKYVLASFNIKDKAGNNVSIENRNPDVVGKKYDEYRDGATAPTDIPVLFAQVENPGVSDTEAPKLLAFEPLTQPVNPGGKGKFRFKITDNLSGIADYKSGCSNFRFAGETSAGERPTIYVCGNVVPEGADWYSIEFAVNPYRPAGEYYLEGFSLEDKAGNLVSVTAQTKDNQLDHPTYFDHQYKESGIRVPRLTVIK